MYITRAGLIGRVIGECGQFGGRGGPSIWPKVWREFLGKALDALRAPPRERACVWPIEHGPLS
jgi:hypothetical protein